MKLTVPLIVTKAISLLKRFPLSTATDGFSSSQPRLPSAHHWPAVAMKG
jgi:hypothetical protein